MTLAEIIAALPAQITEHRTQAQEWQHAFDIDGAAWDQETAKWHTAAADLLTAAMEQLARLEGLEK